MSDRARAFDLWTVPLLLGWALFFLVGLFPGFVFHQVRDLAWVTTQRAWVNSPHVITLAMAGYFGWFVRQRCAESELRQGDAVLRGVYAAIIGVVAFFDYPLDLVLVMPYRLDAATRYLVYAGALGKLVAWGYLYVVVLRYYAMGHFDAFAGLLPRRDASQECPSPDSHEAR